MKYISVKKKLKKRKIFIEEGIRFSLPKPKIPLVLFWNVHKSNNIYFEQNVTALNLDH